MSPRQTRREKIQTGLQAGYVGNVIGRTLDHLRWVSVLALVAALVMREASETYGLYLLFGAVLVAGLVAVVDVARW